MIHSSTTTPDSTGSSTARLLRTHLAADPILHQRYTTLRRRNGVLHLSQYDLSDRCNLRCDGCLYFAGQANNGIEAADDLGEVERFFAAEAARGINYMEIRGAEPALVQDKLAIAARYIPCGVVYTNGSIRIRENIPYRLHISLWGLPEDSRMVRGAMSYTRHFTTTVMTHAPCSC